MDGSELSPPTPGHTFPWLEVLLLVSAGLVVAGVVLWSVPAALVVAGVVVGAWAWLVCDVGGGL